MHFLLLIYMYTVCSKESRNLCDSGIELLKVGIPNKKSINLRIACSIPELCCTQRWNLLTVGNILFPSFCNTFSCSSCYLKGKKCQEYLGNFEGTIKFCKTNKVKNKHNRLLGVFFCTSVLQQGNPEID